MSIVYIGYNIVAYCLLKILPLVLIGVLIFNLVQRRFIPNWGKKRMATFYLSIMILVLLACAFLIFRYRFPDLLLIPAVLGLAIIAAWKRKAIFPFRIRCEACGKALTPFQILLQPENRCKSCHPPSNKIKS